MTDGRAPQIVNISSGLGSVQTMKDAISGEREGLMRKLSLAYKMSKAALNMREFASLQLPPAQAPLATTLPGMHVGSNFVRQST